MPAHDLHRGSTAFLTGLLLLGACATSESVDHGVSSVQFQDVAVPDGMKLVDRFHESHSREVAGWRYGHFEYVGQAQLQDACSHVLQRMPQHMWQLALDESPDASVRRLRFERGRYVADYTLQRVDGVTHMKIDYTTQIENR